MRVWTSAKESFPPDTPIITLSPFLIILNSFIPVQSIRVRARVRVRVRVRKIA